jgi:hypothetical protein
VHVSSASATVSRYTTLHPIGDVSGRPLDARWPPSLSAYDCAPLVVSGDDSGVPPVVVTGWLFPGSTAATGDAGAPIVESPPGNPDLRVITIAELLTRAPAPSLDSLMEFRDAVRVYGVEPSRDLKRALLKGRSRSDGLWLPLALLAAPLGPGCARWWPVSPRRPSTRVSVLPGQASSHVSESGWGAAAAGLGAGGSGRRWGLVDGRDTGRT